MRPSLAIGLTCAPLTYLALTSAVWAGTITAQGNVTALDDISQMPSISGSAMFNEETQGMIPLDQYADQGLTLATGELGMILMGVMEVGEVPDPMYTSPGVHFPFPIAGGGQQIGSICLAGGAALFTDPITQFGLTAGGSTTLYITAWDQAGVMLGQVTWEPDGEEPDAAWVGIDTMGVPLGLLTVGNDDVFGGAEYDVLGAAARSDNWMWGVGAPCMTEAECFDDTWSCTARACNAGQCEYSLTTEPCDDGSMCTEVDTCSEGQCIGTEVECADTNVCTFDFCEPDRGCINQPIEECCLSDDDCPDGGTCLLGSNTCLPPPPPPPGDGDGDSDAGGDEDTDTGGGETGPAADDSGGGGCSCTSEDRGAGALFGLLGLALLAGVRRRRRDDELD